MRQMGLLHDVPASALSWFVPNDLVANRTFTFYKVLSCLSHLFFFCLDPPSHSLSPTTRHRMEADSIRVDLAICLSHLRF